MSRDHVDVQLIDRLPVFCRTDFVRRLFSLARDWFGKKESNVRPIPLWNVLEDELKFVNGSVGELYVTARKKALKSLRDDSAWESTTPEDQVEKENRAVLPLLYEHFDSIRPQRAALCLSGGGIRSATFALGAIQALAECGILEDFDYLSTVSGGGYIGSWLSAWIHNENEGRDKVIKELKRSAATSEEPAPIQHLRDYSNYLSPRLGVLSVDVWTLLASYVRNLVLNWLILLPLLAIPLLAPRYCLRIIAWIQMPQQHCAAYCSLIAGALLQVWAIACLDWSQPSLGRLHPAGWRRFNTQKWFLLLAYGPLITGMMLVVLAWSRLHPNPTPMAWPLFFWNFFFFQIVISIAGWGVCLATGLCVCPGENAADRKKMRNQLWQRAWRELAFVTLAAAFCGWLTWAFATLAFLNPYKFYVPYVCLALPIYLTAYLLSGALLHGIVNALFHDDEDLEWTARAAGWALITVVAWTVVSALVLFAPMWLLHLYEQSHSAATGLGVMGALSGVLTAILGKSPKTPANGDEGAKLPSSDLSAKIGMLARHYALVIAAPVFILFMAIALSFATDYLVQILPFGGKLLAEPNVWADGAARWHLRAVMNVPIFPTVFCWTLLFAFLSAFGGWAININSFSLHRIYRNRLIRAYLGASRPDHEREKDCAFVPFTGFDPKDDIDLHQLRRPDGVNCRPLHVINIALNLVHGGKLGWQQRKAESFTATCLHAGNYRLGYRDSKLYGGGCDQFKKQAGSCVAGRASISLGTAMAISGAAASPNMGYHSSPTLAFLLTFFNVRLGAWLGNPGEAGGGGSKPPYAKSSPRFASLPLIQEAFSLTDDTKPYVYLSDGGHFENLGIYEMVRRRCTHIVVCDAGADSKGVFDDLGNAIRKIYIDMGVEISFDGAIPIFPRGPQSGRPPERPTYFAAATIWYSKVDEKSGEAPAKNGQLIYIKPAFYGIEPADIYNYAQGAKDFPHESTLNQFFTESQFESYRKLGYYIGMQLCSRDGAGSPLDRAFAKLFKKVEANSPGGEEGDLEG